METVQFLPPAFIIPWKWVMSLFACFYRKIVCLFVWELKHCFFELRSDTKEMVVVLDYVGTNIVSF